MMEIELLQYETYSSDGGAIYFELFFDRQVIVGLCKSTVGRSAGLFGVERKESKVGN